MRPCRHEQFRFPRADACFGAAVRGRVVNGFVLTGSEYGAHQRVPPHDHERAAVAVQRAMRDG